MVACVVPAGDAALSADTIRAYARERLASYKVPRKFVFFAQNEVEMTGSAKVKPAELRAFAIKKLANIEDE